MACVEPGAEATAAFDDDDDANDAVAVEDSVKDEDLECDGRSFVVDAVVDEDVVVGIIKESPAPFPANPDEPHPPLPSSAKQPVDADAAAEEDAAMPMQWSPPQQQALLPFDDEDWPE